MIQLIGKILLVIWFILMIFYHVKYKKKSNFDNYLLRAIFIFNFFFMLFIFTFIKGRKRDSDYFKDRITNTNKSDYFKGTYIKKPIKIDSTNSKVVRHSRHIRDSAGNYVLVFDKRFE